MLDDFRILTALGGTLYTRIRPLTIRRALPRHAQSISRIKSGAVSRLPTFSLSDRRTLYFSRCIVLKRLSNINELRARGMKVKRAFSPATLERGHTREVFSARNSIAWTARIYLRDSGSRTVSHSNDTCQASAFPLTYLVIHTQNDKAHCCDNVEALV